MAANMSTIDAANTTLQVVSAMNDLTGDWWARVFLIGFFMVLATVVILKTGETLKGLVSASFLTTTISMLFYAADLTGYIEPLISVIALVTFTIALWGGGKE